jgi:hypothetical protein
MERARWAVLAAVIVGCGDSAETGGGGSGAGTVGGAASVGGAGGVAVDGGGGAAGGSDAVPAEFVAACEAQETLICAKYFECASDGLGEHFYGDLAGCVAHRTSTCTAFYRADGATAADLDACTAALGDPTCDEFVRYWYDALGWADYPEECVYRGVRSEGEPCETFDQCASGLCSVEPDDCGVCEAEPSEGDSCSSYCQIGFACIGGTCVVLGDVGDACDGSNPCHSASWCDGGVCAAVLHEGDACDPNNIGCAYDVPVCAPLNQVCAHTGPAGGLGDSCWVAADGSLNLCNDAHCEISEVTGEGACVAAAGEGEECNLSNDIVFSGSTCDVGLTCVDGACAQYGDILSCE